MLPKQKIDLDGHVLPIVGLGASIDVDGTSASAQSGVFDADGITIIRLSAVTACRILIGTDPTALATSTYVAAGMIDYFPVPAGQKIAVFGGKANMTVLA